jgi:hypothetical protein
VGAERVRRRGWGDRRAIGAALEHGRAGRVGTPTGWDSQRQTLATERRRRRNQLPGVRGMNVDARMNRSHD